MRRKARRRRRPLPRGAALLSTALLLVGIAVVVVWSRRAPDPSGAVEVPIAAAPAARRESHAPPAGFTELLRRYLIDRRLDVSDGGRDADLTCGVPPGRSTYRLNSVLTRAVRSWGGEVISGDEVTLPGGGRGIDLVLRLGSETRRVRLIDGRASDDRPRLAIVIRGFGEQDRGEMDRWFRLPFTITPAIRPGAPRSAAVIERCLELGRGPLLDISGAAPGPAISTGIVGYGVFDETPVSGAELDRMASEGLFLCEAGTSEGSELSAEAARRGVRCFSADDILDNGDPSTDRAVMTRRLREASALALSSGSSIVVASARRRTLEFFESVNDSLSRWGCRPVPMGELLR